MPGVSKNFITIHEIAYLDQMKLGDNYNEGI